MQHRKTVYSGRLIQQVLYTPACGPMSDKQRAGKLKATSEAQKRLNARNSYEKLAGILATNFPRGSNVVVLTYDDEHYPKDRKRVDADIKAFRKRAAAEWKRRGKVFRMAWSVETKHGEGRWHAHAVISAATGSDTMLILKLWGKGSVHSEHLKVTREENHLSLARYMAKEVDSVKVGAHVWHVTANCARPEVEVEKGLSDSETLQLPKGCLLIERETHTCEWGSWSYIKYYIPEEAPRRSQMLVRRKA